MVPSPNSIETTWSFGPIQRVRDAHDSVFMFGSNRGSVSLSFRASDDLSFSA